MNKFFLIITSFSFLFSFSFVSADDPAPAITFTAPTASQTVMTGSPITFSWTWQNPPLQNGTLSIRLRDVNNIIVPITTPFGFNNLLYARPTTGNIGSRTSFTWNVPANFQNGTYRAEVVVGQREGSTFVVGPTPFPSVPFTVTGRPTISLLAPLQITPRLVFQPRNTYRFSFKWSNLDDDPTRKWVFNFTRVMDGNATAADGLGALFNPLFHLGDERVDGKQEPVDIDFTVPANYASGGLRKFVITARPYDADNEPQGADKDQILERTFCITNVRGDVDGNGCVGVTDLSMIAQFILLRGTDEEIQNRDYPNDVLRYDINGDGVVNNADLAIQAQNFNTPICAASTLCPNN